MTHVPMGDLIKLFKLWEGETFHEVTSFKMYYSGWECDDTGYIVTFRDKKGFIDNGSIVLSNHGSLFIASKEHMVEYLRELQRGVDAIESAMHQANMIDTVKDDT